MKKIAIYMVAIVLFAFCNQTALAVKPLPKSNFDTLLAGQKVTLYTLRNHNGMVAQITNYGARLVSLWVPSKKGGFKDVLWGYPTIKAYLSATDVFAGPIVGRYGNRIAKGKFSLDGKEYSLTLNNNGNHLHGGINGFWKKVWNAKPAKSAQGEDALVLTYVSPDGEEGYPGNVTIKVTYTLTKSNDLTIAYEATTDAPTIINPTSHAYFNLHGTSKESTNSHVLTIYADSYTPTDSLLIPTGKIAYVDGTPLDFRKPTTIGKRIGDNFEALKFGKGYDHNWILNKKGGEVTLAAEVFETQTGILMKVYTDQRGLQFYSGNFMDGIDTGKRGEKHMYRSGIALETQNFPDAPNHSNFPSAVLRPGETYMHFSKYSFSIR